MRSSKRIRFDRRSQKIELYLAGNMNEGARRARGADAGRGDYLEIASTTGEGSTASADTYSGYQSSGTVSGVNLVPNALYQSSGTVSGVNLIPNALYQGAGNTPSVDLTPNVLYSSAGEGDGDGHLAVAVEAPAQGSGTGGQPGYETADSIYDGVRCPTARLPPRRPFVRTSRSGPRARVRIAGKLAPVSAFAAGLLPRCSRTPPRHLGPGLRRRLAAHLVDLANAPCYKFTRRAHE